MNTLNEIKAGKTGYGLLVENDGYISMNEGKNKELYESYKLNESIGDEFNCPYPFIVNAVFQKFGVKNANGRIYPEEVLKKEVEKSFFISTSTIFWSKNSMFSFSTVNTFP